METPMPLPAPDIRSNLGTWAVPTCLLPAVAGVMLRHYDPEPFDPDFNGQGLETIYFDTKDFALRKARAKGNKYLVLRVRCYQPSDAYALSAKTEGQKFRMPISSGLAEQFLNGNLWALSRQLPPDFQARLLELVGEEPLTPMVKVNCQRYAVEDDKDRLTLDVDVDTDTGRCLPAGILEFKSTDKSNEPPDHLGSLNLRPIKISKFLWATDWR
jgi:hypothetical protein